MPDRLFTDFHALWNFLLLALFLVPSAVFGQRSVIQGSGDPFPFRPHHWFTPIGLIEDVYKSAADESGALVYDFGPGPYSVAGTTIGFVLNGARVEQTLESARTAIVESSITLPAGRLISKTFSVPPREGSDSEFPSESGVRRLPGRTSGIAWADPIPPADPAFRNVAWGTGRPIVYRLRVLDDHLVDVVLGFCDAYRKPGQATRIHRALVEGSDPKRIDLMESGSQNEPQVFRFTGRDINGDGEIEIRIEASGDTQDPNILLNVIWLFDSDLRPPLPEIKRGDWNDRAKYYVDCGADPVGERLPARLDVLSAEVEIGTIPELSIKTKRSLSFDLRAGTVKSHGEPFMLLRPAPKSVSVTDTGYLVSFGDDVTEVSVIRLLGFDRFEPVPDTPTLLQASRDYWKNVSLPYSRLVVSDSLITARLDASIRTMFQVREVVDGTPEFHPGIGVYRGLWVSDGTWFADAVGLVGDEQASRESVVAVWNHAGEDGRIDVMSPARLLRETPQAVWLLSRHFRLFDDLELVTALWPGVKKATDWLIQQRQSTLDHPGELYYGLMPPGLTDGGLGGINPEYSSVYWGLIGLNAAIFLAERLGYAVEAKIWHREYEAFHAQFLESVTANVRFSEEKKPFLPMSMAFDPEKNRPQQGQGAFLQAVYPGRVLDPAADWVSGTMDIIGHQEAQGLAVGVGWMKDGVWPFNATHRALAAMEAGDYHTPQKLFEAFGKHGSPTHVWSEEQLPTHIGTRTGGDMPQVNSNAQYIRLARNLLVFERPDRIDFLGALPVSWLSAGGISSFTTMITDRGPLHLSIVVSKNGESATVTITPQFETPVMARLLLSGLAEAGYSLAEDRSLAEWLDFELHAPTLFEFVRDSR